MRMTKAKKQNDALDIPVLVKGFVEDGDQVGIQGVNLVDGTDITVYLTTQGKSAENTNRNSLKKLRDGFKIGRTTYNLEAGGIVSFKQCFPLGDTGKHLSAWANAIAYNEEDAKNYAGRSTAALLQMGTTKDQATGAEVHFGTLYTFNDQAPAHVLGNDGAAVKEELATVAGQLQNPAFLVRIVDADNQVVAYDFLRKSFYDKEAKARLDGAVIAEDVAGQVDKLLAENPGTVNIVPAERYSVSPESLKTGDNGKSQLPHFATAAMAFTKKVNAEEYDVFCKDTFYKTGGDRNQYVNGVYPIDRFGAGQDPVLLGGLTYSPALAIEAAPTQADEAAPAAEAKTTEAPAKTTEAPANVDESDPFADLDNEDFEEAAVGPR